MAENWLDPVDSYAAGRSDTVYYGPQATATLGSQANDNAWNQFWGELSGRYSRELAAAQRADAKNAFTAAREDTQLQRQVADAKAAGLNPLLMNASMSGAGVGNYAVGESAGPSGLGSAMMTGIGAVVSAVASKAIGAKLLSKALAAKTAAGAAHNIASNYAFAQGELYRLQRGLMSAYRSQFRRY